MNKEKMVDFMIRLFREGENYLLESVTCMAEHSEQERQEFHDRAIDLKNRGANLHKYLVKVCGYDEDYLNELLRNEGI